MPLDVVIKRHKDFPIDLFVQREHVAGMKSTAHDLQINDAQRRIS